MSAMSNMTGTDPVSIVEAFDAALNRKDAKAAAALFADDATITSVAGTTRGKDEIRKFLDGLVAQNFQFMVVGDRKVQGNKESHMAKVTTDETKKMGIGPLDANAEVTVDNGKITMFNVTYTPESQARLKSAR